MGFVFMMIMQVIMVAGEFVSMQMGLSFSTLVDPESHTSSPIVGQFFHVMMLLLFLSLNIHLSLLKLFKQSMEMIPLGKFGFPPHFFTAILDLLRFLMEAAFLISLPLVFILLLINLATGIISKAASQLNIFAIGLPVSMMVGLFVLGFSAPMWGDEITRLLEMGLYKTADVMR